MKKLSASFLFCALILFSWSCSKNSPRSMAEELIGGYNGVWNYSSTSLNNPPTSGTYGGTLAITEGSNHKSIIVHGIEFELVKGQNSYSMGQHSLTITNGSTPSIHFETGHLSPGGSSHKEFTGSKQ